MFIRFNLENAFVRRIFFGGALVICGLLVKIIVGDFVVGTLSDKRIAVNKNLLTSSIACLPASARLLARRGAFEAGETNARLEDAENDVSQAAKLSPNNYRLRLLLAEIRDGRGERDAAEQAFEDALELAPNYSEVHWKYANFLARRKRIEASIEHFRIAADLNPTLVAATLDLVWTISGGDITFLKQIVRDNQKGQLKLALLLANESRSTEAAEIFSKTDKNVASASWESSSFFDRLIKNGFSKLAFDLWLQMKNGEAENIKNGLVWNGDFERENDSVCAQFDWRIGKSAFARIGFDSSEKHSGTRSLLVDFSGRDATQLENEIRHLIVARAGSVYRLEFFVKTENFTNGENLRVVVSDSSGKSIAQSEAVSEGTADWQQTAVNFTAPKQAAGDSAALFISVKRQPRDAFDAPTRGQVWFDDFAANEVKGK